MKKTQTILYVIGLLLIFLNSAQAHPMGNFSINHYSALQVDEDRIQVRYILDFAEIPAFQERQIMDLDADGLISEAEKTTYLTHKIPQLAEGLVLNISGERQQLKMHTQGLDFSAGAGGLPTMRLDIVYENQQPSALMQIQNSTIKLDYADQNYARRAGWKELAAKAGPGLALLGSTIPLTGSELRSYPDIENTSPPQRVQTQFSIQRAGSSTSSQKAIKPIVNTSDSKRDDAFTRLVRETLPVGQNLLWVLLAALALGATHALSPGHGKTLVAAYLVGSQGSFWHALLLGLTVTFSHTIGVFLLGFMTLYLSDFIVPEQLYPWLSRFSGLTILIIGLTIFRQRWRSLKHPTTEKRHPHGHEDHMHKHHHAHPHHHSKEGSLKHILGLGVSGGMIPCPSALIVLLSAVAFHQITFGLLLIFAFSLGLAATLVTVGLFVVYLGNIFKHSEGLNPILRFLPAVSAAGMAMLGGFITFGSGG